MPSTIRAFEPRDEEAVIALWRACGLVVPANDPVRDIARKVAFQPSLFLVAEDAGVLVGAAMAGYEGHRGWIYYLGVAPDRQREGIGRTLVAAAATRLRALGCPKINLMVRHSNTGVIEFYRKLGFARDAVDCMGKRLVDDATPSSVAPAPRRLDVSIRPYRRSDADALIEAAIESVEHVYPWLPFCRPDYGMDEAITWIEHCDAGWIERTEFNFAMVDGGGRYLGGCGLNKTDAAHGTANLGYWVRSSAAGQGAATEAARQLAEFAWRETDLQRLEIVASVENLASRRVAEKAGAAYEGIAHSRLTLHGRVHDAAVYALVRALHAHP